MPILRDRPDCPRCGAKHSESNRVNWWDQYGTPYGPQTKPEKSQLLCDTCAQELFGWREELLSRLRIEQVTYDQTLSEMVNNAIADAWLDFEAFGSLESGQIKAFLARVGDTPVGFLLFRLIRESDRRSKYFIEIDGLSVAPEYRALGIGGSLLNGLLVAVNEISVNYFIIASFLPDCLLNFFMQQGAQTVSGNPRFLQFS